MSKSIRVTMSRPTISTVWPFDIFPWSDTLNKNFLMFEEQGVESWILGNEDNDLTLVVDHYFPSDTMFNTIKDSIYPLLPMWCNSDIRTESESYCTDNSITILMSEVDNPDLSSYIKITISHPEQRTYEAIPNFDE
jgi:hypothetical protein